MTTCKTPMNRTAICEWLQDDEDSPIYNTSCGGIFVITEGTPEEHRMKYCCYCGRNLIEYLFETDETNG